MFTPNKNMFTRFQEMANTFKNDCETIVKLALKKAFESADSLDEKIEAFKNMESRFQENELGVECLELAEKLHTQGENPEKVICFGKRALKIFLYNENENMLLITCALRFLATACFRLNKYEHSFTCLNWAHKNLDKLDHDGIILVEIQLDLFTLCSVMGKRDEAAFYMEKVLKIMERMSYDEGRVELGNVNRNVCKAYISVMNFEAALPFALKALEIYKNYFRYDNVDITEIRRFLGVIYCALGEHDKALKQNQSSFSVLRSIGHTELINVETEICNVLIESGKYEKAVIRLRAVVSNLRTKEADRGIALVFIGRAFCYMECFEKAKKYMKIAHEILDKEERNPVIAAVGFGDMSVLYEMMGDFDTALSLIRRVLTIPELPQKLLVDGSTRLFSLITLAGKEKEGIAYLEDVLEKLKASLGPEHSHVGYCYVNLGITCQNARRLMKATKYFALAKDVQDVSLGPNHLDSLKTSQTVSLMYTSFGRYDEAIDIQEKVVKGLEGLVPSKQALLDEAVIVLDKIKVRKNSWWCSIL